MFTNCILHKLIDDFIDDRASWYTFNRCVENIFRLFCNLFLCSEQPATSIYSDPLESVLTPLYPLDSISILILFSHLHLSLLSRIFGFEIKITYAFLIHRVSYLEAHKPVYTGFLLVEGHRFLVCDNPLKPSGNYVSQLS
jgi:hypothetical protein